MTKKNLFIGCELNDIEKQVITMLVNGEATPLDTTCYLKTEKVVKGSPFKSQPFIDNAVVKRVVDSIAINLNGSLVSIPFNLTNQETIDYTFKFCTNRLGREEWLSNYDIDWYVFSLCNNLYYDKFKYATHCITKRPKDFRINDYAIHENILNKFIARYIGMYKFLYAYGLLSTKCPTISDPLSLKLKICDLCLSIWPVCFGGCVCRDFNIPSLNPIIYKNLLEYNELQELYKRYPTLKIAHVVNTTDSQDKIPQKHWFGMILTKKKNYVMCSYSDENYMYNIYFHNTIQGAYRVQCDNYNCGVYSILFVSLLSGAHTNHDINDLHTLYDQIGKNGDKFFQISNHRNINALRYALFNLSD